MCAPKGVGPRRVGHFPCKEATSEGAAEGAKGADHGPRGAAAGALARGSWRRRSCPRCGSDLFPRQTKADERMAAPKGRETWPPGGSSLQIARFLGSGMGAMMPFMDPSGGAPLVGDLGSRRPCWWAKAVPRCGSTSRVCGSKRQMRPLGCPQRTRTLDSVLFPCKPNVLGDAARGHHRLLGP